MPGHVGSGACFPAGTSDEAGLRSGAKDNIHLDKGTLSFWWKPRFDSEGLAALKQRRLFNVGYDTHYRFLDLYVEFVGDPGRLNFTLFSNVMFNNRSMQMESPGPEGFFVAGQDFHVVLTWDNAVGIKLYINGRLVNSRDCVWSIDGIVPDLIHVGSAWIGSVLNSASVIDEVRITHDVAPPAAAP
ncbi:MAG: hypothetical protein IT440_03160 [Phycisphaeraceae bacterium]|nr:hypothetical protein [Phycisphaeraceae bacterium]